MEKRWASKNESARDIRTKQNNKFVLVCQWSVVLRLCCGWHSSSFIGFDFDFETVVLFKSNGGLLSWTTLKLLTHLPSFECGWMQSSNKHPTGKERRQVFILVIYPIIFVRTWHMHFQWQPWFEIMSCCGNQWRMQNVVKSD